MAHGQSGQHPQDAADDGPAAGDAEEGVRAEADEERQRDRSAQSDHAGGDPVTGQHGPAAARPRAAMIPKTSGAGIRATAAPAPARAAPPAERTLPAPSRGGNPVLGT